MINFEAVLQDIGSIELTRSDTDSSMKFCYNCWYLVTVVIDTPEEAQYRVRFQRIKDSGSETSELPADISKSFSLSNTGDKRNYKFIFTSKDSFEFEVKAATGEVRANIGLDPDLIDIEPLWTITQSVGTGVLEVATDDFNFHIGTYFYVSVEQTSESSAAGSIKVSQIPMIQYLANGVGKKLQFFYDRELVKRAVFAVPSAWSSYSITTLKIEKLCAHIYPAIYLKKIESDQLPDKFESLDYPSIVDYDLKFGDNFSTMVNKDSVSGRRYKIISRSANLGHQSDLTFIANQFVFSFTRWSIK